MSPAYKNTEQYERWHVHDCVRCGRRAAKSANWEGAICRTCHDKASQIRGRCPGCGSDRLLPGRRGDAAAICRDCAGITRDFFCDRCGVEGLLLGKRLCERCTLTDKLTAALDDGTGRVYPTLVPLFDILRRMDKPKSGLSWVTTSAVRGLLGELASGRVPLTHEAFHRLEPWRAAAHLRELLMSCGLLPLVDKNISLFESWLHTYLPGITGPVHARVVRQFATWQVLPWLRRRATTRALTPSTRRHVGSQVKRAAEFLQWLADQGRNLPGCTQGDLDRWHVEHLGHERQSVRPFLQWAMRAKQAPRLTIPLHQTRRHAPITHHRRLALLRRLLTEDTAPLRTRVAAVLMLLYAQPLTRVVRLTTSDILVQDGHVLLRLGTPATPVPEPFAGLLLQFRDDRANGHTGANRNSPWLFPGRRAGQPLRPDVLGAHIRALDIPTALGRTAALRQLVLQAPAPVVADALGYHSKHVTRVVTDAGGTWSRYASGDHSR